MPRNIHPPKRPILITAVILLVVSVVLLQLPLLNYLGYEFSCALALLVPFTIGIAALRTIRYRLSVSESAPEEGFRSALQLSVLMGVALLLLPLVLATLNMVFVKNCSYAVGVIFYLLLPVVTLFFSVALAAFCVAFSRKPLLLYFILLAVMLLHPLYVGYVSPQIYSYNFIFGFFPGFSYDEVLRITPTLLFFRGFTLLVAALLYAVSLLIIRSQGAGKSLWSNLGRLKILGKPGRLQLSIWVLLIAVGTIWAFRTDLGFESSVSKLKRVLSSHTATEHFVIYYAPGSFTDEEIHRIAAEHEFRFSQVTQALAAHVPEPITSYIYPDDETKRLLLGTRTTNIAKPWMHEIHLDKDSWEGTLKHELVHAVAGEFGMPIIHAHYNIGLVEGLATAIDDDFGNRTLHQYAAAIRKFGIVRNPGALIKPVGFAMQFSSASYVLMGSFCKYLIDRFGIVRFKDLYRGRSVESVYQSSYETLVNDWQKRLDRVDVPDSWRRHVEFFFNRPSIFAKECARAVALMNEMGYRALRDNQPPQAMEYFSEALETSWNSESYAGMIRAAYQKADFDSVVRLFDARVHDSTSRFGLLNLGLLYGDAQWVRGHIDSARATYNDLLSLDLSDRFDEAVVLRLAALDDTSLRASLASYFTATRSDSAALSFLHALSRRTTQPLVVYLEARVLIRMKHDADAVLLLQSIGTPFQSPALNAGRELLAAQSSFLLQRYTDARIHFWESMNYISNEASRNRVDDWLNRCDWYERYGGRYLKGSK